LCFPLVAMVLTQALMGECFGMSSNPCICL
jgi:hypothetical protein